MLDFQHKFSPVLCVLMRWGCHLFLLFSASTAQLLPPTFEVFAVRWHLSVLWPALASFFPASEILFKGKYSDHILNSMNDTGLWLTERGMKILSLGALRWTDPSRSKDVLKICIGKSHFMYVTSRFLFFHIYAIFGVSQYRHDICQFFYTSTFSSFWTFTPKKRVNCDILNLKPYIFGISLI